MAIHERAYTGVYPDNHREFVCDFTSDVDSLPTQQRGRDYCATSSTAFVIEDSSKLMVRVRAQGRNLTLALQPMRKLILCLRMFSEIKQDY